jgi:hypothetical protein
MTLEHDSHEAELEHRLGTLEHSPDPRCEHKQSFVQMVITRATYDAPASNMRLDRNGCVVGLVAIGHPKYPSRGWAIGGTVRDRCSEVEVSESEALMVVCLDCEGEWPVACEPEWVPDARSGRRHYGAGLAEYIA